MELASDTLLRMLRQQGDETGMRAACQNLIDSGYDQLALKVMFNLGTLLEEHGDVVGAKAAYQQVIDSGHSEEALMEH
jgi:Tetratricopeptide repeat